jgi:malonyl-CoA O-methyltransferase
MADDHPPTLDPVAARRWSAAAPPASPWLHEEVGRRMAGRLEWIRLQPQRWVDWEPVRGGVEAHALVRARYPGAACRVAETPAREALARRALSPGLWTRLKGGKVAFGPAVDGEAQMLWSNMALHMASDPGALIARWHAALATDGFLMFSCLGPDTLRELRAAYAALGWAPPAHDFTDMHDWGDMLVHAGFAEPVMDMERIVLTWGSADAMLAELRGLGANLRNGRFPGLRGRGWRAALARELEARLAGPDGRLSLTFEVIYGHALKPAPRVRVAPESSVSLGDMQALLKGGRKGPG